MIRVMIAEDSLENNIRYCKFLTKEKNIEIISRTVDFNSTLSDYFRLKPDVLIISFRVINDNKLRLIEYLSLDIQERKKCNIIIISNNFTFNSNAFCMAKIYRILPENNFHEVITTIKEIYSPVKNDLTRSQIKTLLLSLKFNLYSKGTHYIIDAIQIAYKNPNLLYNITNLYEKVAHIYNIDSEKVQRSIRNSIDVMNSHIPNDKLQSFFHVYEKDIVPPKYFFTIVIEYFLEDK